MMENLSEMTARFLRDLIRFDTTNPPGNELAAAQYIGDSLRNEGIEAMVLEAAPGRGNVVARLRGDGSADPLLLMSHLDVVPADPTHWTHPPFGGDLVDGYIWGRGAVDTKNLTALQMAILITLKRQGLPLRRDVILAATADEEIDGHQGMGWLTENHPELVTCEYAINEGGGFGFDLGGKRIYVCQTSQKGVCWLNVSAQGTPGHASMPHQNNAVAKLCAALSRLANARLPQHRTATVEHMIRGLAATQPFPLSFVLPLVLNPVLERPLLHRLGGEGMLGKALPSMLHNTAVPTVLSAGQKTNVIPASASAKVDCRILPGQTPADLLREIQPYLGRDATAEVAVYAPPFESDHASPLFDCFAQALQRHDSGATLIPYMLPGGTDGPFVAKLGAKVYGFCPLRPEPGWPLMELAHAHDERISVANLGFAAAVLYDIVSTFCSQQQG